MNLFSLSDLARFCDLAYSAPSERPLVGTTVLRNDPHVWCFVFNHAAYVFFRGTDTRDLSDLSLDARIVAGNLHQSDRVQEYNEFVQRLISVFDRNTVFLSGHSLGGTIAYLLGSQNQVTSVSFNPGSFPSRLETKSVQGASVLQRATNWLGDHLPGIGAWLPVASQVLGYFLPNTSPATQLQHVWIVDGDLISEDAKGWAGDVHVIPPKLSGISKHSLENFL